jgi:hypothetical protein
MAKARTGAQKPEVEKIMGQHHVFYFADGLLEKKNHKKYPKKNVLQHHIFYFADGLSMYSRKLSQEKYQTKNKIWGSTTSFTFPEAVPIIKKEEKNISRRREVWGSRERTRERDT